MLLYASTEPSKFATVFYGILDVEAHRFRYCNGGHNPPFLFSGDAEPHSLEEGGTVLGFLESATYTEGTTPLHPGDVIVIYSDGVTEAMNAAEEEFEEARLQAVVREYRDVTATALIDAIVTAINRHAAGAPQADDITIVVIRRTA